MSTGKWILLGTGVAVVGGYVTWKLLSPSQQNAVATSIEQTAANTHLPFSGPPAPTTTP